MLPEWFTLLRLSSITPSQKRALVACFGDPETIFSTSPKALTACQIISDIQIRALTKVGISKGKADLKALENLNAGFIPWNAPEFPALLNEIPSPPLGIFYRGDIKLLRKNQIAIVGSRNASPGGLRTATGFSRELSRSGLLVTSGMAAGIDSAAHNGALSGEYATVAVMGTGIDQVYPQSNISLYKKIVSEGVVISEFPPGTPAKRQNFPQRNRIISGLSLGTLVVEAGIRSGSLITARLAAEQGRDVFAIPGSIHMSTSRGCHKLIRDGAKLVETIDDIIEETGVSSIRYCTNQPLMTVNPKNQCDILIYKLIDYAPTPLDTLIEESGMTPENILSMLLELELQGLIVQTSEGYQKLPIMDH